MDSPSSPKAGLGATLAEAWAHSTLTTRVLLVAWAVLPFAALGGGLVLRAPAAADHIAVLAPQTSQDFVRRQRLAQDATAKQAVTKLVPAVDRCGAATRDFTRCSPDELARFGADPRTVAAFPMAGKVAVTASLPRTYTITAASRTGAQFEISRTKGGGLLRTCTPAGTDGCGPTGRW